ncbi:MAG: hypothetical protein ABIQ95_05955 [Bdellovibrionia bacterium]
MKRQFLLASFIVLSSSIAMGNVDEAKVIEYLDHSDRLLIDLITDYRKLHQESATQGKSSKGEVDDAMYQILLKKLLSNQQIEELYPIKNKTRKSKITIPDETENQIIVTVFNFSSYIKSAPELYPIYVPTDDEKSRKDGIKIYKKRLANNSKNTLENIQDNCNNGLSFTVIKPAVIEMFYNTNKDKFFEVFSGTMASPLRSLTSGYVFAKTSTHSDDLKNFLLHSGFQVQKCSLLKMEKFQNWLMHAESGTLHNHEKGSNIEEEDFSFDLDNKNIKTQNDFISHILGFVFGKLDKKEKEELEKLDEAGQEPLKINFFFSRVKKAIEQNKLKFGDKEVLIMDKPELKYKYKGKASRPEFLKEHLIIEPSQVRQIIADTLGIDPGEPVRSNLIKTD